MTVSGRERLRDTTTWVASGSCICVKVPSKYPRTWWSCREMTTPPNAIPGDLWSRRRLLIAVHERATPPRITSREHSGERRPPSPRMKSLSCCPTCVNEELSRHSHPAFQTIWQTIISLTSDQRPSVNKIRNPSRFSDPKGMFFHVLLASLGPSRFCS